MARLELEELITDIADVKLDPAHDMLVGRGGRINIHDRERVEAPVAVGVQNHHVS